MYGLAYGHQLLKKFTFVNISIAAGLLMSDFKMTSGDMAKLYMLFFEIYWSCSGLFLVEKIKHQMCKDRSSKKQW